MVCGWERGERKKNRSNVVDTTETKKKKQKKNLKSRADSPTIFPSWVITTRKRAIVCTRIPEARVTPTPRGTNNTHERKKTKNCAYDEVRVVDLFFPLSLTLRRRRERDRKTRVKVGLSCFNRDSRTCSYTPEIIYPQRVHERVVPSLRLSFELRFHTQLEREERERERKGRTGGQAGGRAGRPAFSLSLSLSLYLLFHCDIFISINNTHKLSQF